MFRRKLLTAMVSTGIMVTLSVLPASAGAPVSSLLARTAAAEGKIISAIRDTLQENRADIQAYKAEALQAKEEAEQKAAEEEAAAQAAAEEAAKQKAAEEEAKKKEAEEKKKKEEEARRLAEEQAAAEQAAQEEAAAEQAAAEEAALQAQTWLPIEAENLESWDEPVYEEPVYEEPVYEEPVYEEPVYEEEAVYDEDYEDGLYEEDYAGNEEGYVEDTYDADAEYDAGYEVSYYNRADLSDSEMDLLAAIIYCEAGGESYEGQVAVGAVVLNRMDSGLYPNDLSDVIYQSGQFEPAWTGRLSQVLASGAPDYCYESAQAALNGENPVGDCLYFHAGSGGTITIGNQTFY